MTAKSSICWLDDGCYKAASIIAGHKMESAPQPDKLDSVVQGLLVPLIKS